MEPVEFGGGDLSPAPEPQQDSLKNVFLNEVDPNDRPILEKYVDKWDAGATKRFQKYSEQLKGYEALGSVDEIQKMRQFINAFDQDPERVFKAMYEGLAEQYGDDFDENLMRILELEEVMSEDYDGQGGNEPDPDDVWRGNVENDLNDFREWRQQQEAAAEAAENNRQLDTVLKAMHNAVGEFDEDYVLQRLAVHGNPQKAFQEFQQMVGKFGGKTATPRQAPRTLGGQGGVPSQEINPHKLRGSDRRKLVEQLLEGNG